MENVGGEVPAWVGLVDFLASESLRVHLRVELDLRAILRSQDRPEVVLARVERVLQEGIDLAKKHLLTARALLILNKLEIDGVLVIRVAEQVAALQMLLLARVSGWACANFILREVQGGRSEVCEFARVVVGLTPMVIDLEGAIGSLFPTSKIQEGMPAA